MIWDEAAGNYVLTSKGKTFPVIDNEVPAYPLKFGLNQTFTKLYLEVPTMEGTVPQRFLDEIYNPAYNDMYTNSSIHATFQIHPYVQTFHQGHWLNE